MKRGLSVENHYDYHDRPITTIQKQRGRLTLEEIEEVLRLACNGLWQGHYAIILNCTESSCGGDGWGDEEDPKGDAVDLYKLEEGEYCPVCSNFTPPYNYCPQCGTPWRDMEDTVEKRLASMLKETERSIKNAPTMEAKKAWYWCHIGAIDMARQLDFITDERRQELYKEMEPLKPILESEMKGPD